jgi:hypothetical protein
VESSQSQLSKMLCVIAVCRPKDFSKYKILNAKDICENDFGLQLSASETPASKNQKHIMHELDFMDFIQGFSRSQENDDCDFDF